MVAAKMLQMAAMLAVSDTSYFSESQNIKFLILMFHSHIILYLRHLGVQLEEPANHH
jgi:hypothetical protein